MTDEPSLQKEMSGWRADDWPTGEMVVPLRFVEKLERAQLELLAMALYREDRQMMPWGETLSAVRDQYRMHAHVLMQGEEPVHWKK